MTIPQHDPLVHAGATSAWRALLADVIAHGDKVSPRGLASRELLHATTAFSLSHPVVRSPARRLSYRYLAAQALWILSGSDRLAGLGDLARLEAPFSDDGETLWGAYGPRLAAQLPYVTAALARDPGTRQAWLTLWRPEIWEFESGTYLWRTHATKDVPCTIALGFNLRHGQLHCHALMRSSDLWLGWPYDMFTFTMVTCAVAATLRPVPALGTLRYTAASAHLYQRDVIGASAVLNEPPPPSGPPVPPALVADHPRLIAALAAVRDRQPAEWDFRSDR